MIYNEMHAGFLPLRRLLPMNMWRPVIRRELTPEAAENVKRIEAMWAECRERYGQKSGEPFLFGGFGAADAMYAPVVARLHTYGVNVGVTTRAYIDAVMALPAWQAWSAAALKETWVLPADEVDWRLFIGSSLKAHDQFFYERALPRKNFLSRRGEAEIRYSIDFGEILAFTGMRWPFRFGCVVRESRQVEICLNCKGMHDLAALLTTRRERYKRTAAATRPALR